MSSDNTRLPLRLSGTSLLIIRCASLLLRRFYLPLDALSAQGCFWFDAVIPEWCDEFHHHDQSLGLAFRFLPVRLDRYNICLTLVGYLLHMGLSLLHHHEYLVLPC